MWWSFFFFFIFYVLSYQNLTDRPFAATVITSVIAGFNVRGFCNCLLFAKSLNTHANSHGVLCISLWRSFLFFFFASVFLCSNILLHFVIIEQHSFARALGTLPSRFFNDWSPTPQFCNVLSIQAPMAYLSLVGSMQSLVHVSTALCPPSPGSASMSLLPCGSFRAPTKVGFATRPRRSLVLVSFSCSVG